MKISIKKVIDFPIENQMEILKWRNSKEISKHFLIPHIDETTHRNWLESQKQDNPTSIAFFICDENNNLLGCNYITHIDYNNLTCESGIFLNPDNFIEGVGVVSSYLLNNFIFDDLKMYKINTRILGENKKVILAHKRNGYNSEGILKNQILKEGRRYDIYLMSLFKDQWDERKNFIEIIIKEFL